jgi:hypothetical protein
MKMLSAYTYARYCSDATDLRDGIAEIYEAIQRRQWQKKSVPYYFYIRLEQLQAKLNKLLIKNNNDYPQ